MTEAGTVSERIRHEAPTSPGELRRRLYAGDVFLVPRSPATERLVEDVVALLTATFGPSFRDPEVALLPDFWWRIVGLRKLLAADPRFRDHATAVAGALGFDPERTSFSPFRLRAILHLGHELPVNASAYVIHRDTWYAHPAASVGAWIPLTDVTEEETFFLYPRFFDRPVFPNESEGFEYATGAAIARDRQVAEQHREAGRTIDSPEEATGLDLGPRMTFSARRADALLFSSAHLHSTQRNGSGRTRFSVDCRLVDVDDHARGLGAVNVDSRCRGSAIVDYLACVRTPSQPPGDRPPT